MERNPRIRIFVIDDEPIALTRLERMVTPAGVCDTTSSGIAATECFVKAVKDNQPYDLITIDIQLPDISGLELLDRFIRLEKDNGIVPAKKIMVAAHSTVDCVVKAKDMCDAYVVKPVRKANLLTKIDELCSRQWQSDTRPRIA